MRESREQSFQAIVKMAPSDFSNEENARELRTAEPARDFDALKHKKTATTKAAAVREIFKLNQTTGSTVLG